MKIVVTGGAGFIGSHLADRCLGEGHEVVIIDDLSTGFRRNVNPDANFVEMDIRDRERVFGVFGREQPQAVFHLAAQMDVRRAVEDPVFDAECNVFGSLNLMMAAAEARVRKFVFAATGGAMYGETDVIPTPEEQMVRPVTPYGVSKRTAELYLHCFHVNEGLRYVSLRYGNVYGPRQNPKGEAGVVAIFAGLMLDGKQPTVFGDGTSTRDYVFVDDVVDANVAALNGGDAEIYNVGTGRETRLQEIFDAAKDATGYAGEARHAPERKGELHRSGLDISKAREQLGWSPKTGLAEGIAATVAYWRDTRP
ncbi:MAG: NAD-dependent epimerase/dehydratase family protein [Armatimonadota bacterium]|jgi:UDP-glucose 4-epimerase